MKSSQTFRNMQTKWMENVMTNPKLCDTVFVVGPNKQTVYGMRSLLATMSCVFQAQLYGSFAESKQDTTIEYPTISAPTFKCIIRASFALDPLINAHNVIPLMKAANMLQIEALIAECKYFLSHSIDEHNVLEALNSAYLVNSLDELFYKQCKRIILNSADSIISTKQFESLHPDLVIEIISWDYLKLSEEKIWTAAVQWATNVEQKQIRFPVIKKVSVPSLKMNANKENNNDSNNIKELCALLIPYIRFPLMNKQFFVDKTRDYLTREQFDSVMIYHLLNRKSMFSVTPRRAITNENIKVVTASCALKQAKKLLSFTQAKKQSKDGYWSVNTLRESPWFIVDIGFDGVIESFELTGYRSLSTTCKQKISLYASLVRNGYEIDNEKKWIKIETFNLRLESAQEFKVKNPTAIAKYWRFVLHETEHEKNGNYNIRSNVRSMIDEEYGPTDTCILTLKDLHVSVNF